MDIIKKLSTITKLLSKLIFIQRKIRHFLKIMLKSYIPLQLIFVPPPDNSWAELLVRPWPYLTIPVVCPCFMLYTNNIVSSGKTNFLKDIRAVIHR